MRNQWNPKIKQMVSLLLFLSLCLVLGGCKKKQETEYKGEYIFSVDTSETKVTYQKYRAKQTDTSRKIQEYLSQLCKEPKEVSMKKAIPDDVKVEDFVLGEGGQLSLYFNAAYGNLTGASEILRRAAIVKTLCQIDGVDAVQFYVAGQPLADSNREVISFMTADMFIDNTGGESSYTKSANLILYFADMSGNKLIQVPVDVTYDASIPMEELAIQQLIRGTQAVDGIDSSIKDTIPEGTVLNTVTVKDSVCYVDFSSGFLEKNSDISPEVTIYSVVNTLTELPNINKVQFSIDGSQVTEYGDSLNLSVLFQRNLNLVIQ